jgi:hypothetical protein
MPYYQRFIIVSLNKIRLSWGYKRGQLGSIIQVQRIEGELFESEEQAEQQGVRYARNGLISRSIDGLKFTVRIAVR